MKKIWSGIKKLVGAPDTEIKNYRPEPLPPLVRPVIRWRWRGWRRPSFRRKSLGPLAKRRAARQAFIADSQRQGIEIAAERRTAQLRDRKEGGHFYMKAFVKSTKGI